MHPADSPPPKRGNSRPQTSNLALRSVKISEQTFNIENGFPGRSGWKESPIVQSSNQNVALVALCCGCCCTSKSGEKPISMRVVALVALLSSNSHSWRGREKSGGPVHTPTRQRSHAPHSPTPRLRPVTRLQPLQTLNQTAVADRLQI